jgi:hypothetical protein
MTLGHLARVNPTTLGCLLLRFLGGDHITIPPLIMNQLSGYSCEPCMSNKVTRDASILAVPVCPHSAILEGHIGLGVTWCWRL